ncbi:unnamed protein product, partial [Phaeothamnion confervicola]
WVDNFVRQRSQKSKLLSAEGRSADKVAIGETITKLRTMMLAGYDVQHIYNVDGTGRAHLQAAAAPDEPLAERGPADGASTKGTKAKDSLSASLCTNTSGTHMLPLSVIGLAKNPRCF